MKKLFTLLLILGLVWSVSYAQTQNPQSRIAFNKTSGSQLNYGYGILTDVAGEDTINIRPNAWFTQYAVTLTSNQNWKAPLNNNAYIGDQVKVFIRGNAGNIIRLIPSASWNVSTLQTFTLTANVNTTLILTLFYTGYIWILTNSTLY